MEPILEAAEVGDVDFLTRELEEARSRGELSEVLATKDADHWTPLHFAAQGGTANHTLCIKLLVQADADVNAKDRQGWTPLHVAAQFAEPAGITELLEAFADRESRDVSGHTPRDCSNGPDRRRLLERPFYRMEQTLKKVTECFAMQQMSDMGMSVSLKENWVSELVDDFEKELAEASHDTELRMKKMDKEIAAMKEKGKSGELGPLELAKALGPLTKERAKIAIEEAGIADGWMKLKKMKQKQADDELIEALEKVKGKLAHMRKSAVANENTQMKLNRTGYVACMEILDSALKQARDHGDVVLVTTAESVQATLGTGCSAGVTPPGFRRKLEDLINQALDSKKASMAPAKAGGKEAEKPAEKRACCGIFR